MKICEAAFLLGANVIEKHFTHDKKLSGNDHYHSMDKDDLSNFRSNVDYLLKILGSNSDKILSNELSARKNARRSLVLAKSIKSGDIITKDHLTFKRPASGISPKFIDEVIGKSISSDEKEDTILKWKMLD